MNENTESREIDLLQMASALLKRWWIIAIATILGGVLAFGYSRFFITPKYQAKALFYVNNSSISAVTGKFVFNNADSTLVETYCTILTSRLCLEDVIKTAGLSYSYEQILGMISSQAVNDTEIFSVTVTSTSPQEACDIANTVASVLPQKVTDVMEGAKVKVVDYAVVPLSKSSPSNSKNTVIGMFVGFVIAAALIVFFEMTNDTIGNEEWLVTTYGDEIPLLAVVPDVNAKNDRHYYRYGKYGGYGSYGGYYGPTADSDEKSK